MPTHRHWRVSSENETSLQDARTPFNRDSDRDFHHRLLGALTYKARAAFPNQAALEALELFGRTIELLRLRYCVDTHIYGDIKVSNNLDPEVLLVPLPQPFWRPGSWRREVPQFPAQFDIFAKNFDQHTQNRWWAARWHLSQAFGSWSENVHTAGAEVWQAIEGFTQGEGSRSQKEIELVNSCLAADLPQMAKYLTRRWSVQNAAIKDLVSDESLATSIPSALLFDQVVGLLPAISRRIREPSQEKWMDLRLRGDLELLYALRNLVVHSGSKLFSARLAEYLAKSGLELLVSVMNSSRGRVKLRQDKTAP